MALSEHALQALTSICAMSTSSGGGRSGSGVSCCGVVSATGVGAGEVVCGHDKS